MKEEKKQNVERETDRGNREEGRKIRGNEKSDRIKEIDVRYCYNNLYKKTQNKIHITLRDMKTR